MPRVTLSAEQFGRICSSMVDAPPQEGPERRRAARVEFRSPVLIALTEGTRVLPAIGSTLRDISPRGATLCHDEPLSPGRVIVFFLGTPGEPVRLLAQVVHCKCFAGGEALVGLEFIGVAEGAMRESA